jgi:hypothetical protein
VALVERAGTLIQARGTLVHRRGAFVEAAEPLSGLRNALLQALPGAACRLRLLPQLAFEAGQAVGHVVQSRRCRGRLCRRCGGPRLRRSGGRRGWGGWRRAVKSLFGAACGAIRSRLGSRDALVDLPAAGLEGGEAPLEGLQRVGARECAELLLELGDARIRGSRSLRPGHLIGEHGAASQEAAQEAGREERAEAAAAGRGLRMQVRSPRQRSVWGRVAVVDGGSELRPSRGARLRSDGKRFGGPFGPCSVFGSGTFQARVRIVVRLGLRNGVRSRAAWGAPSSMTVAFPSMMAGSRVGSRRIGSGESVTYALFWPDGAALAQA